LWYNYRGEEGKDHPQIPYAAQDTGLETDHVRAAEVQAWRDAGNLDKISKHLDPHRLAVTEAVFGVLLAALAIQLMLDGLAELGVIQMLAH